LTGRFHIVLTIVLPLDTKVFHSMTMLRETLASLLEIACPGQRGKLQLIDYKHETLSGYFLPNASLTLQSCAGRADFPHSST